MSAVGDMLLQIMLEADIPEEEKTAFLIIKAAKELNSQVHTLVDRYAKPKCGETQEAKKQVLEYLLLVQSGIKAFEATMDTTENQNI